MKRDASSAVMVLYAAALLLMAATLAALLDWLPGVERMTVSGLTTPQAVGLTAALMALIALRLFLHLKARRDRASAPE